MARSILLITQTQKVSNDGDLTELIVTEIIPRFSYDEFRGNALRWWAALRTDGILKFVTLDPENFTEALMDLGFHSIGIESTEVPWRYEFSARKADAYGNNRISWQMPIKDEETVLEVGPGNFPFERATHYLDISNEFKRDLKDKPLTIGSVESMQFKDGQFDVALASHVLEHVRHPDRALKELQRVAKRGWIECPSAQKDWILQEGHVHPLWQVVKTPGNTLVFVALGNQARYFNDEAARNYIFRVTQQSGMDNYLAFTLRRLFWSSDSFLNPIITWGNGVEPKVVVIR